MYIFLFIIVFLVSLSRYSLADDFVIQVSPPINISGFVCECSLDACSCRQGDIVISVDLTRRDNWKGFARKTCFLGECFHVCDSRCVNAIGVVTSLKIPFLTVESLRNSVRQVDYSLRKSMTFTERITNAFRDTFGSHEIFDRFISMLSDEKRQSGTGSVVEDVYSVVKEKSFRTSDTESESVRNDLTMYLLTQMIRDMKGYDRRQLPKISDYAYIVKIMSDFNREGRLTDFIALYLYLKKKGDVISHDFVNIAYDSLLNSNSTQMRNENQEVSSVVKDFTEFKEKEGRKKGSGILSYLLKVFLLILSVFVLYFVYKKLQRRRSG